MCLESSGGCEKEERKKEEEKRKKKVSVNVYRHHRALLKTLKRKGEDERGEVPASRNSSMLFGTIRKKKRKRKGEK